MMGELVGLSMAVFLQAQYILWQACTKNVLNILKTPSSSSLFLPSLSIAPPTTVPVLANGPPLGGALELALVPGHLVPVSRRRNIDKRRTISSSPRNGMCWMHN